MIRRTLTSGLTALALLSAAPVLAQEEGETVEFAEDGGEASDDAMMGEMLGALGGMFAVEPLTDEQNTRLPLATSIVDKMIPAGSMAEMMDNMLGGTFGSLLKVAGEASPKTKLAEQLGLTAFELADLSDEDAGEMLSLFDPRWEERQQRESELMPQVMGELMSVMEPPMKKAMSELYAINFSEGELGEIDTFFSTETGANFARKSFTMAADPRIIGASMEALPEMMGAFASIDQSMAEATADLGTPRTFDQLSGDEKAFVSEAIGMSAEDIEYSAKTSEEVMEVAE